MTENKRLNEEIIDIQCRSMRDNLIFYGIKEEENGRAETVKRLYLMFVKMCSISMKVLKSNTRIEWAEKRTTNHGQ